MELEEEPPKRWVSWFSSHAFLPQGQSHWAIVALKPKITGEPIFYAQKKSGKKASVDSKVWRETHPSLSLTLGLHMIDAD